MATNITEESRRAFDALKSGRYGYFCQFSCYVGGEPAQHLRLHARPSDVTEGYAADWTVEQLRESAQQVADRIDELAASA